VVSALVALPNLEQLTWYSVRRSEQEEQSNSGSLVASTMVQHLGA